MILLIFIAGILFVDILLPILENIGNCLCARMEQYKAKCMKEISIINEDIEKIQNHEENNQCFPIGFQVPIDEVIKEDEIQ